MSSSLEQDLGSLGSALRELARPAREVVLYPPGTELGEDYVLGEVLGVGGLGVVYRARDRRLDRDVAVKVHLHVGAAARERLVREASAMAKLAHPNVVAVYRAGDHGDAVYVAMELVDGGTLRGWLRERRARDAIVAMFAAIGDGLAAAHAAGVVHRDVKPDNVVIGRDERPRLTDFGVAGTPAYMAPEQWRDEDCDARADQFAFAVALWEALAGAPPFPPLAAVTPEAAQARLAAIEAGPRATRALPRRIEAALRRALAAEPAARFPAMDALVAALRRDRVVRRRRIALALGTVGPSAVAAAIVATRGTAEACTLATAPFPDARAAITAAFDRLGAPWARASAPRVAAAFAARVERWQTAELAVCQTNADGKWPAAMHARARRCLDRRLVELTATRDALVAADVGIAQHALDSLAALPDPERCADPGHLDRELDAPADPAIAARVEGIERVLARAAARRRAGDYPAATKVLAGIDRTTRVAAADAEIAAEAARLAAAHQADDASAQLAGAFLAARRANLAELATELAVEVGTLAADRRAADARHWIELAEADIAAAGLGARLDDDLARAQALLLQRELAFGPARTAAERAVAAAQREHGGDADPDVIASLSLLARIVEDLGDHAGAMELGTRAVAAAEAFWGPEHPGLLRPMGNLSLALASAGRTADALAAQQRAVALARATLPGRPELAYALLDLGIVHLRNEANAEAVPVLEEALAILRAAPARADDDLYLVLNALGLGLSHLGRYAEARPVFAEALAEATRLFGPRANRTAAVLQNRADLEWGSGDLAAALASLTAALDILTTAGSPTEQGNVLADLADLHLDRDEPGPARDAAQRALATYANSGVDPERIVRAENFLAEARWRLGERAEAHRAMTELLGRTRLPARRDRIQRWLASHPRPGDTRRVVAIDPEADIRAACARDDLLAGARRAIEVYGPDLARYLGGLMRDESDAAEAFGATCEAIWRGLAKFRWESPLRPWLYRLAHNAAMDLYRSPERRRAVPLSDAPELAELAVAVRTRTPPWQRTDVKDRLAEVRAQLAAEDRELLVLRVDRELPWAEIVDILADEDADAQARARLSAALRKRFERLKEVLRAHLAG